MHVYVCVRVLQLWCEMRARVRYVCACVCVCV